MVIDSSALLLLVVPAQRAIEVEGILHRARRPALSDLAPLEVYSGLGRLVRSGALARDDGRRLGSAFAATVADGVWRIVSLSPGHLARAAEWLADPTLGLRTLDAIHVSVAHALGEPLLTADRAQARAARRLGVKVRLV